MRTWKAGRPTHVRRFACPKQASERSLLLVADVMVDTGLAEALAEASGYCVDLLYADTSRATRTSKLGRHLSYWRLAWTCKGLDAEYQWIVFWQQFAGVYRGLLPGGGGKSGPNTILLTFIFRERQGIVGRIQRAILRHVLSRESVRAVVCYSSVEVEQYGRALAEVRSKLRFVTYGYGEAQAENGALSRSGVSGEAPGRPEDGALRPYLFSGGASNRDFRTLAIAAKAVDSRVVVACSREAAGTVEWPANVEVRTDAYGAAFNQLLEGAAGVVILLGGGEISSGQIVLLRAMRAGKPIIVTATAGAADYVDDSCAWLVPVGDASAVGVAMRTVLNGGEDVALRAARAERRYGDQLTASHLGRRVGDLVTEFDRR